MKAQHFRAPDPKNEKGKGIEICHEYIDDYLEAMLWSNAVKYLIIGINFVLRVFIIKICIFMGRPTESEQTELITNGVFVC
jgi:hypothetical protein